GQGQQASHLERKLAVYPLHQLGTGIDEPHGYLPPGIPPIGLFEEPFLSLLSLFLTVGSAMAMTSPACTPLASTIMDSLCLTSWTSRGANLPSWPRTKTVYLPLLL